MQCEQALELISAALDGELTPSQRTDLEAHLNECPSCAALFDELAGHARLLRQLDCQPPEDLTERILSQLPDQFPKKGFPRVRWMRWGSLAACAALVVWAGFSLPRFAATQDSSTSDNNSQVENQTITENAPDPASLSPEDDVQPYAEEEMAAYDAAGASIDSADCTAASEVRSTAKDPEPSTADHYDGPAENIQGVQYLRTTWTGANDMPTAQLLSTRTELTDCLALYPDDDLSAVAEHYNDAYFQTGCLLAVSVEESSGSTTLQVETVSVSETGYQVTIRQETPEVHTDDMASWLVLIETEPLQTTQEEVTLIIQD